MLMNNVGRLFSCGFVYFSKLRHVYLISSRNDEGRKIAQSSFSTTIFHARFAYPPDDILRKAIPGLSLRTLMTISLERV